MCLVVDLCDMKIKSEKNARFINKRPRCCSQGFESIIGEDRIRMEAEDEAGAALRQCLASSA